MGSSANVDDDFESVPLRGAGRSLAQRAQAHLKSLKKTLKDAFKDAGSASRTPAPTSTYGNETYVDDASFVASPRAREIRGFTTRARRLGRHARRRSHGGDAFARASRFGWRPRCGCGDERRVRLGVERRVRGPSRASHASGGDDG